MGSDVAFLFLGETLLLPHLFPILDALASGPAAPRIDAWVSTSLHVRLIEGWLDSSAAAAVSLRQIGRAHV